MIKLIIFDFDGVIVTGSNKKYFYCYHQALTKVGIKLDPEVEKQRILERWGQGYKKQLQLLLKEHPKLLSKATKKYQDCYFSSTAEKIKLVPGTKKFLELLSQKYILAIASGKIRNKLDQAIKKFHLQFFKKIVTNEDLKREVDRKPAPYMLNKIMRDLSIKPNQTIYVGDAANDVIMARNAGVTPVVVLTGLLTKPLAQSLKVKFIIKDITGLANIIPTII